MRQKTNIQSKESGNKKYHEETRELEYNTCILPLQSVCIWAFYEF